ncbi:MAG: alanine--tRNA ligase, partial [Patescibacteria group bacterium]
MTSSEIRKRFLIFFEKRGHAIIPSASLVPENDPTVLFNTAGMQPLVPFLMGNKHSQGDKLVNIQKCVRTTDIDDVGDRTHATFFEMLGNWSLGSYFKEEAIRWSFEFLTSKSDGLGLDPTRLYITVFGGNEKVPKDEETTEIWKSVGVPQDKIFYKGVDSNWWPAVKGKDVWTGPTGPCTEMFYDVSGTVGDIKGIEEFDKADEEQRIIEVWNDVFMEYEKKEGAIVGKLEQRNVDTGAGLERLAMVMQNVDSIFETDLFLPIIQKIYELSGLENSKDNPNEDPAVRILADHVRTSVFLIADGVIPSNTDRGYVLRRLVRRAVRFADKLGLALGDIAKLSAVVPQIYNHAHDNIWNDFDRIQNILAGEEQKFRKTLSAGIKEIPQKAVDNAITGEIAFNLSSVFGIPPDVTADEAKSLGIKVKGNYEQDFLDAQKRHQELSRIGSGQRFKGGLADTSEKSLKYHTATHLLNSALKAVLGPQVNQKGSNITPERLRFDFTHDKKLTTEQIKHVEKLVNEKIKENLTVSCEEMPLEKAKNVGAVGVFGEKYADRVKVYSITDIRTGAVFSRE